MTEAILISQSWMETNTPIPYNLDTKEIYPFYATAQDKHIRDALGDALYERLCDAVINGVTADDGSDDAALLLLVRPSLGFYTVYEALPFLATKIKNIGINQTADAKQTNADRADRKDLRAEVLGNAQYYLERVKKFLCQNENRAKYPEYNQNNPDVNPRKSTAYAADIYIDPDLCIEPDNYTFRQYIRKAR